MGTATKLTAPPRLKDVMTTLINGLLSLFVPHARLAILRVIVFTHTPHPDHITVTFRAFYRGHRYAKTQLLVELRISANRIGRDNEQK